MANVGDLFVNVRARTTALTRGLRSARRSVRRFASSTTGLLSGIAAGFVNTALTRTRLLPPRFIRITQIEIALVRPDPIDNRSLAAFSVCAGLARMSRLIRNRRHVSTSMLLNNRPWALGSSMSADSSISSEAPSATVAFDACSKCS